MPGPARAGALIYAHDLQRMSVFYQAVLGLQLLTADDQHQVLESADTQLILHAIPAAIAATFTIDRPPAIREEQAIKLFFSVDSLADAGTTADRLGGGLIGPEYAGPGFVLRNAYDPEGNVLQLRQWGGGP